MVMPPIATAPSTPKPSSLMIDAPPVESPTPTKPLSAELPPVLTPASYGVADPPKSSTHVENIGAKRRLFDNQSTYKEDQMAFAQSGHHTSHQLNINVKTTGHDEDTEEDHSEDPLDTQAKKAKTS
ncbi:uncharacterized protein [Miscanthus floridulus]|uniref:uncharacterized protein n=1 Tax=Miscanthus floridulus TaxID=154761 RepID=UPI0034591580